MRGNRGILAVIAAILIIGIAVTCSTNRFISREESTAENGSLEFPSETAAGVPAAQSRMGIGAGAAEDAKAAAAAGLETGLGGDVTAEAGTERSEPGTVFKEAADPGETAIPAAGQRVEAAPAAGQTASEMELEKTDDSADMEEVLTAEKESLQKTAPAQENALPEISPLDGGLMILQDEERDQDYYEQRLLELDAKIKKMRSEATDSTTYAMKEMAEKELRLWDTELNNVYGVIAAGLAEEEKEDLVKAERKWMKERDAKAVTAAKKYRGGTLEGVEYTAALAESTRQRTYDLVHQYAEVLDQMSAGD